MSKADFPRSMPAEVVSLVVLNPMAMGFVSEPSRDEILNAEFLRVWSNNNLHLQSIELCPPEVGPRLRMVWGRQPHPVDLLIAMKCIRFGRPGIFNLGQDNEKTWLRVKWMTGGGRFGPYQKLVFRLRQSQ
jgi:hypothetical protein